MSIADDLRKEGFKEGYEEAQKRIEKKVVTNFLKVGIKSEEISKKLE